MVDLSTNQRSIVNLTSEELIKHIVEVRSRRRNSIVSGARQAKAKLDKPKAKAKKKTIDISKMSKAQILVLMEKLK